MSKQRINWIDWARGIGMLLIIIGHTYATGFWQYLIFAVNVPIFFVLSGYLTRLKTIRQTLVGGVKTLLIPYAVTATVIFCLSVIRFFAHVPLVYPVKHWYQFLVAGLYGIGTPTQQSIFHGVTMPSIGAIWFLLAMYIGNVIFQLILRTSKNRSRGTGAIIMVIISIVLASVGFTISKFIQLPWSINAALISPIFYTGGHLIKEYQLLRVDRAGFGWGGIALLLWLLSAVKGPFWFNTGFATAPTIDVLGALGGSYFIMLYCKAGAEVFHGKFLAFFGRRSMLALAFHITCIDLFGEVSFLTTKLVGSGLSTNMTGFLMDAYRIAICIVAVVILDRIRLIRKLYAIR